MRVGNMEINCGTGTLGAIIAIIVLILAIVFMAIGQLSVLHGSLLAALAFARLT